MSLLVRWRWREVCLVFSFLAVFMRAWAATQWENASSSWHWGFVLLKREREFSVLFLCIILAVEIALASYSCLIVLIVIRHWNLSGSAKMAAFNLVVNMYDPALKPRLIHKLLRVHVPDDKRAFNDHSELSKVVSMIKIHNLLSESLPSMDQKLIDSWKSAVDSWVNRLFLLLSNDMV